jgi:hypothetical protein
MLILLLKIINSSSCFFKEKIAARLNKNQCLKKNPNSLASGTHDSGMLLILKLSIIGSLELLEDL